MAIPLDYDRDRVAATLKRHYLRGRLTVDELSERLDVALGARSNRDLGAALRGLPAPWSRSELEPLARTATRSARRAGLFVGLTALWMFLSTVLLVAFVAVVATGGSGEAVAAVPLAWLLATWLVWRTWRRSAPR
jgi:Flp pilus assembly protein TadB